MMFGAVLISNRQWLLPAAGFLLVAILLLLWTYLRAPADKNLRTACALLKLLGVAALLACLLEPLWSGQRAKPGANYFAVVADNSQGMAIKDKGETRTRSETLTNLLSPQSAIWLRKLEENFQARRYYFDARLQSTRDFSELAFDGRASSIGAALRTIGERFRGQPLAGILLFTDGNATDMPEGKLDTTGLPPIYPVVIGRDESINDIAIRKVATSQTAFEDAPVTLQAEASASGYSGKTIAAQLLDAEGKTLQEQIERPSRDETASFRFQVKPENSGVSFYQVRVSAKVDPLAAESSTEATLVNNSRVLVVDRGRGPYRILYVSGRPNWEFKFLNRALAEDDQIELAALIRIAKREPKFDFRGRAGESSNPLFRGFDRKDEETERYDQPVLKWFLPDHSDTNMVGGGFPKTAEALFAWHAVILDDLEAEFFTRDQMVLLQRFVSERGGGLLMLGGAESFQQGKYEHTPVGDMLPVYLDAVPETRPLANLKLHLTREGWLQPWARLRNTETEEKARLEQMPAFQVLNRARDAKPGASVIATVQDDAGKDYPALAAQRFGHGRVGAMLIGDIWRWGMHDEQMHRDMDKAWRQTVRWLIADVPKRIEFYAAPKRDDPNQAMTLQVRARDKEFRPLDNATVKITVTPVEGRARHSVRAELADTRSGAQGTDAPYLQERTNTVHITAEPALGEAGVYEAAYVPRATGGYLAEATVIDAEGVEVGRAQAGWASDPAAEEFKSLRPNRALLENLARQTGGELVAANGLESFAAKLPNRNAPITESWSRPLWHQPAVFLLALACFAAEWGLRRWKGLA
jgi:uncharacterized membrane protein